MLQFYLVALCTNAVLTTVGTTFFKFDQATELQIKLCQQYGLDISMLEIGIMDLAHDVLADDEAHAYEIATFKDERVAPLVQDMFRTLRRQRSRLSKVRSTSQSSSVLTIVSSGRRPLWPPS